MCRKGPENGLKMRVVPADRARRAGPKGGGEREAGSCGKEASGKQGAEGGASAVGLPEDLDDLAEI
jgi:hypothetical protein